MRIPFAQFVYDTGTHEWFDKYGRVVFEQQVMVEVTCCPCGCGYLWCPNCRQAYCPRCDGSHVGEGSDGVYWACVSSSLQ